MGYDFFVVVQGQQGVVVWMYLGGYGKGGLEGIEQYFDGFFYDCLFFFV